MTIVVSWDTYLMFACRSTLMNWVTDKLFYYFYTGRIFHLNYLYEINVDGT